jgi:hypothetical protein
MLVSPGISRNDEAKIWIAIWRQERGKPKFFGAWTPSGAEAARAKVVIRKQVFY